MTDDLKERLRINLYYSWGDESDVGEQALSYITDLEARLAAAEAEVQRIKEINVAHCRTVNTLLVCESRMETRAKAAEAGEDALAEAFETAAQVLDGECELARIALPQAIPVLWANARAIRALTPADALAARDRRDAQMRAEGMREAADLCKPKKAKMRWGDRWTPSIKNPQSAAAQDARKQCYDAILAAVEKEEK